MTIPLAICIVGLILWGVASLPIKGFTNAWFARLGELSFFAGLLAYLLSVSGKPVW